jgi:GDPmannose 4,6-dehydratase
LVSAELGMKIIWKGKGMNEKGYLNNKEIISIDKKYFRPTEVDSLLGNSSKAKKELKWKPTYDIFKLAKEMVTEEIKKIE